MRMNLRVNYARTTRQTGPYKPPHLREIFLIGKYLNGLLGYNFLLLEQINFLICKTDVVVGKLDGSLNVDIFKSCI